MSVAALIGIAALLLVLTVVVLTLRGGSRIAGCFEHRARLRQARALRDLDESGEDG